MKAFISFFILLLALQTSAQQKPTDLDKSPMDMSYWPANYPILKMTGKVKEQPIARIIYSRPLKNNRTIFDGIIKYNEVWRLGANEATEIEFFAPVKIGGKLINKGRYSIFCIPNATKWTIILNKDNYAWGSFMYDNKKDVIRVDLDIEKNVEIVEAFTAFFEETKQGANLFLLWDDVKTALPITLVIEKLPLKK